MEWLKELWDSLLDENYRARLFGVITLLGGAGWATYLHFSKRKVSSSVQVFARDDETTVLQRDWNIRNIVEWWEQAAGIIRGDGNTLGFFRDLRQAACDGNLTVWGRPNSEHRTPENYTAPLQEIPKEHWENNDFDVMPYIYADNEDPIRMAATPPGTEAIPEGTRYVDLHVTSTEVKQIWPVENI